MGRASQSQIVLKHLPNQRIDGSELPDGLAARKAAFDVNLGGASFFRGEAFAKEILQISIQPFAIYIHFLFPGCSVSFKRLRA